MAPDRLSALTRAHYFGSIGLPQHSTLPSPPLVRTTSAPHLAHLSRFPA